MAVCPERALARDWSVRGEMAVLSRALCTDCGTCVEVCYPGTLKMAGTSVTAGEVAEQVAMDLPSFQKLRRWSHAQRRACPALEFSYNILLACQQRGIHTALETTGYARWEVMSRLADVTDLLLYDVKFADPEVHRRYTGVPNRPILSNLLKLAAEGHNLEVRVTCIHGVNDSEEQIRATARLVKGFGVRRIALPPHNTAAGAKYKWLDRP